MADKRKSLYAQMYEKLLALYPRAFREQFKESMEQTFDDLCNEQNLNAPSFFIDTAAGVVKEHVLQIKEGNMMKEITTNPRSAAIVSVILCLPFTLLFSLAVLNINPFQAVDRPVGDGPGIVQWMMLGMLLLFPLAFVINVRPIIQNWRAGNGVATVPVNLIVSAVVLLAIAWLVGSFVVDQYPCWIGVPNCD